MSSPSGRRVAVLGSSGAVGQELVREALRRGHEVTALARHPERLPFEADPRLRSVAADVAQPGTVAAAVADAEVVVSALGVRKGEPPGVLTAGATALADAGAAGRTVWLGALGTGPSAGDVGVVARTLLGLFLRAQIGDKATADQLVLDHGGVVVHVGPLGDGPVSDTRRTVSTQDVPRRLFPAGISRATVAACLLDQAELPTWIPGLRVALAR